MIDYDVIDEGRKVSDRDAFLTCHFLAREFGLLVGGSTGGAVFEAMRVAETAPSGSKIVAIACDNGSKYLDTIFSDKWLSEKGMPVDDGSLTNFVL